MYNRIIIKTKVLSPQAYVTLTNFGYGLSFPKIFNLFLFPISRDTGNIGHKTQNKDKQNKKHVTSQKIEMINNTDPINNLD